MRWMVLGLGLMWGFAAKADTWKLAERTTLVVAEASLAADMLQTLGIARARDGSHEVNPILGPHPSDGMVVGYFATAMLATAALTYVLPDRWRVLAPAFVLALEVPQVTRNFSVGANIWLPF